MTSSAAAPPEPPAGSPRGSGTTNSFDRSALDHPVDLWGWKGLTIVGTGIRAGLQTTPEARACIEQASRVLYLVGDPVSENWIKQTNPKAESLFSAYEDGRPRAQTYSEIVDRILGVLRSSPDVCVVFYGHPGVLVGPAGEAARRAREEGFPVRMLPGVSSMDNLFSDLGLDPGITGLQTYEATGYLLHRPRIEPTAALILWQIGVVGERTWTPGSQPRPGNLRLLQRALLDLYPADHPVVIYEAAVLPFAIPKIVRTTLTELPTLRFSTSSTLFVPPLARPRPDPKVVRLLDAGGLVDDGPR